MGLRAKDYEDQALKHGTKTDFHLGLYLQNVPCCVESLVP